MNVFLDNLSQSAPENDIVPVGMIGHLCTILERITALSSCQTEAGHSHTLINIANLGLLTDVAD